MPPELRVGIAGTGFIGGVHARSARLAGARVVAVAASSPESAAAAAADLHVERALRSADELVHDPEVDVVHICTPNHLHQPLAEAALAAGKHVVCEKPLALDAAGAAQLVAAAADSTRQAAVPFVYRFYPMVREARERVRAGETGAVHLVHGTYLQDWLLRPEDGNWRVDEALGGASRAFADIGSHWCDLAEFVTGQRLTRLSARTLTAVPERVSAAGRHAFAAGDGSGELRQVTTEDAAIVQFETDAGAARVRRDQPGLRRPQEPALDRGRRLRGGARLRPGAARAAVGRAAARRRRSSGAIPSRCLRPRPATRPCRAAIRRATRTASTPSSRTSTKPSRRARRPTASRCSPTAFAPPASRRRCWRRLPAGSGSTWRQPTRRWPR